MQSKIIEEVILDHCELIYELICKPLNTLTLMIFITPIGEAIWLTL